MSKRKDSPTIPRSMRHKQILEVAAEKPDASMESVASQVPSATTQLVERVLEEHGDPAEDQSEAGTEVTAATPSEDLEYPSPEELSEKERETLRAVHEHPEDSQRELAEKLDITSATVSNRVNGIEGFDWSEREAFANAVLDDGASESAADPMPQSQCGELETAVARLVKRLSRVEQNVDSDDDSDGTQAVFDDPGLARKVTHACMKSNNITEEEEFQILEKFIR